MPAVTFGPAWTDALLERCEVLDVPPAWPLAVFALESGFDPRARNASGARGLWQKMPELGVEYAELDPIEQLRDAFGFWRAMLTVFNAGPLSSREALYCANLAPARLRNGSYDEDTVLYSAPSAAYRQNAAAFGADPFARSGAIRISDLAVGLDAGIARCRARYDAELAAAVAAQARPPREYTSDVHPAAFIERVRPA